MSPKRASVDAQRGWISRHPAPFAAVAAVLSATVVAGTPLPARGADAQAPLTRSLAGAEAALRLGERELAESRFRDALLEGWLLRAGLAVAEGRASEAEIALDHAVGSVADPLRAQLAQAMLALRTGAPDTAVGLLRRLAAARPGDGGLRRTLAQALIAAGQAAEAVEELAEAHRSNPDDLETTFALASGKLRTGQVEEAAALFDVVERERPIAATHVLIGRTYRDAREVERARASLRKALDLDPAARRAHYYLGMVELLDRGYDGLEVALEEFGRELAVWPDDPLTHTYLGMALVETRRCPDALPHLEQGATWEPTAIDSLRFLGKCHLVAGRFEQAADVLERALSAADDRARPRQLASLHYQLAVALQRLDKDPSEHFEAAERLIGDLVGDDRTRFASFFADEAAVPAVPSLGVSVAGSDRLEELSPEDRAAATESSRKGLSRAYFNLGTLLALREEMGRAADTFAAAADLDPDFPRLQRSLGIASFRAQRWGTAAEALRQAFDSDPADAEVRRFLALAELETGRIDSALALLADDPERPSDPAVQLAYASGLSRAGRSEEAVAAFRDLLAQHPDWPAVHVRIGQALASQGDFPGAIAALERALSLDPEIAEAAATLGDIYLRQGKLEAAETALRDEVSRHPGAVRPRFHLAVTLDLAGRAGEAIDQLETVLRAQPEMADARYLLGKVLLAEGRPREAAAHLEAAAALASGDANVHYQLAQAYQRLGDRERAAAALATYRETKARERGETQP